MHRRSFLASLALPALAGLSGAAAAQGAAPRAGTDYVVLRMPQNTETGDRIEVLEFFWYRCPHCYSLEPSLEAWVKRLPQDTQFRRLPAVFNDEWALDARVYFALEALGEVDRVHRALFDAIHQQGGVTQKGQAYVKWVQAWLAKNRVDPAKLDSAMRSFAVDSLIRRAQQIAMAYRLDGVPAIAVDGRYLVSASMVASQRAMLAVTDYLIEQTRRQRAEKK